MILKLTGALCILSACGGLGYYYAWQHRTDEHMLHQLIQLLDYLESELRFRQAPLPELCRIGADGCSGLLSNVFLRLSSELNSQVLPDAECCMKTILDSHCDIPQYTNEALLRLSTQLGHFDLDGQIRCFDSVRDVCKRALIKLSDEKLMSGKYYKTLGLCVGASLIIIFF